MRQMQKTVLWQTLYKTNIIDGVKEKMVFQIACKQMKGFFAKPTVYLDVFLQLEDQMKNFKSLK